MMSWSKSAGNGMAYPSLEKLALALESQRLYFETRLEASSKALEVALQANEVRLRGIEDYKDTVADQSSKMMSRVEAIATIQAVDARNISEVNTLREKLEAIGKPNWVLITSCMSVLFVMVTGIWLIIGLKMDSTVAPIQAEMTGIKTRQDNQTTTQGQMIDRLNTIRGDVGSQKSALAEIETQFCASDIVRNLMHAQDLRTVSMLWRKMMPDMVMPTDNAFYPQVCNRPEYNSK